jgi:outer membrane receptor protein involved in Fe transport
MDNLQISTNTTYGRQNTRYVPDSNNRHGYVLNTMRLDKGYKPGSRDVSWVLETELRGIVDNFITGAHMEHVLDFSETSSFTSNVRLGFNQLEVYNRGVLPFGYELRPEGTIGTQRWRTRVLTAEYIGNWENQISSNVYSTLSFGAQLFNESLLDVKGGGISFSGPGQQTLNSAARTSATEDQIQKINAGFFIQEKINLNELVYIIGGLRIDGNSTFGESYGFEYYPKLSVSYVMSDSEFWNFDSWNTFRLRGAIGYAGQAPGAFDAVRTYTPVSGLDGQPGVTANNLGNPDLGPERTREIEGGFDADLFNSRVNINFTYFDDLTTDALIPVLPVPSTGFSSTQLRNVGEISSKGIELSSNFIPLRTSSFQWSLGLEVTRIIENINDMGGSAFINLGYEQGFKQGFAPPSFFGRKVTNPDEFADPVFEEEAFLGKVFPDLTFIFSTGIDIGRSLSINARGELSKGGHVANATAFLNTVRGYWPPTQELQETRDSEGIESLTAAERAKLSPFYGYDQFIESTDFFKLRLLSVNYDLPPSWTPSGVNGINLSLLGSNLFTITDYSGLDPESMDTRVGSYSQRLDYYTLPPRRSVQLKLNVRL